MLYNVINELISSVNCKYCLDDDALKKPVQIPYKWIYDINNKKTLLKLVNLYNYLLILNFQFIN